MSFRYIINDNNKSLQQPSKVSKNQASKEPIVIKEESQEEEETRPSSSLPIAESPLLNLNTTTTTLNSSTFTSSLPSHTTGNVIPTYSPTSRGNISKKQPVRRAPIAMSTVSTTMMFLFKK